MLSSDDPPVPSNLLESKRARLKQRKKISPYEHLEACPLKLGDLADLLKEKSLESSVIDLQKINANRLKELLKESADLYYDHTHMLPANRLYTKAIWILLLATLEKTIKESKEQGISFKETLERLEMIISAVEPPPSRKHLNLLTGFETYYNPHQKKAYELMEDLYQEHQKNVAINSEEVKRFRSLCFEKIKIGKSSISKYIEKLDGKTKGYQDKIKKERDKRGPTSGREISDLKNKIEIMESARTKLLGHDKEHPKIQGVDLCLDIFQAVIDDPQYTTKKSVVVKKGKTGLPEEKIPEVTPENESTRIIRAKEYNAGLVAGKERLLYDLLIDRENKRCFAIIPGTRGKDTDDLLLGKGNFGDVSMGFDLISGTPCAIKIENNQFRITREEAAGKRFEPLYRDPMILADAVNEFNLAKKLKMAVLQHTETVSDPQTRDLGKATHPSYLQVVTVHRLLEGHDLQRSIADLNATFSRFYKEAAPTKEEVNPCQDYAILEMPRKESSLTNNTIYLEKKSNGLGYKFKSEDGELKEGVIPFNALPALAMRFRSLSQKDLIKKIQDEPTLKNAVLKKTHDLEKTKSAPKQTAARTEAPTLPVIAYQSTFGECLKQIETTKIDNPKAIELLKQDLKKRLEIGLEFLRALETFHEEGIAHGDVKLKNFQGGMFIDCGTSCADDDKERMMPSGVAGTAGFMAPEHVFSGPQGQYVDKDIRRAKVTKQSDVFSANVSLFGYAHRDTYDRVCRERGLKSYNKEYGIGSRRSLPETLEVGGEEFIPLYNKAKNATDREKGEGYGLQLWDAMKTVAKVDPRFIEVEVKMRALMELGYAFNRKDPSKTERPSATEFAEAMQKIVGDFNDLLAEKPDKLSEKRDITSRIETIREENKKNTPSEDAIKIVLEGMNNELIPRMISALSDHDTALFEECLKNIKTPEVIVDIIARPVGSREEHDNYPLFIAIKEGKTNVFKSLFAKIPMQSAIDTITLDKRHKDLVYFAAQEDNFEALKTILDLTGLNDAQRKEFVLGNPKNYSEKIEETSFNLIQWAVHNNNAPMLEYLLKACELKPEDFLPEKSPSKESALHFCAYTHSESEFLAICRKIFGVDDKASLAEKLLELSGDEWKDSRGLTPFALLFNNNPSLVEELFKTEDKEQLKEFLEKQSDPLKVSPLQIAFLSKNDGIMQKILQETDCNIFDLEDAEGRSPLHYLADSSNLAMINYLTEHFRGSHEERKNKFIEAMTEPDNSGLTPLQLLATKPVFSARDQNIFHALMDIIPKENAVNLGFLTKIPPNAQDALPCVYYAAKYGKHSVLDSMVSRIPDIKALLEGLSEKDSERKNTLHHLCERGEETNDTIEKIIVHAIVTSKNIPDKRPLQKQFIALFSQEDSYRLTPLDYAARTPGKKERILKFLRDTRLDLAGNEEGRDFLAHAEENATTKTNVNDKPFEVDAASVDGERVEVYAVPVPSNDTPDNDTVLGEARSNDGEGEDNDDESISNDGSAQLGDGVDARARRGAGSAAAAAIPVVSAPAANQFVSNSAVSSAPSVSDRKYPDEENAASQRKLAELRETQRRAAEDQAESLAALGKEIARLRAALHQKTTETQTETAELKQQLATTQTRLDEMQRQAAEAQAAAQKLAGELRDQISKLADSPENETLKQKLATTQARLDEMQRRAEEAHAATAKLGEETERLRVALSQNTRGTQASNEANELLKQQLSALSARFNDMQRQSKEAEIAAQKLAGELRDQIAKSAASPENETLKQKLATTQARLDEMQRRAEEAHAATAKLGEETERLRAALSQNTRGTQAENAALKQKLSELSARLTAIEGQSAQTKDSAQALAKELREQIVRLTDALSQNTRGTQASTEENAELQRKLDKFLARLGGIERQLSEAQSNYAKLRIADLEAQVAELRGRLPGIISGIGQDNQQLNEAINNLSRMFQALQAQVSTALAELRREPPGTPSTNAESKIAALKAQMEDLANQIPQIIREIGRDNQRLNQDTVRAIENLGRDLRTSIESLSSEQKDANALLIQEIGSLKRKVAAQKEKLDDILTRMARIENQSSVLSSAQTAELAALREEVAGLRAEISRSIARKQTAAQENDSDTDDKHRDPNRNIARLEQRFEELLARVEAALAELGRRDPSGRNDATERAIEDIRNMLRDLMRNPSLKEGDIANLLAQIQRMQDDIARLLPQSAQNTPDPRIDRLTGVIEALRLAVEDLRARLAAAPPVANPGTLTPTPPPGSNVPGGPSPGIVIGDENTPHDSITSGFDLFKRVEKVNKKKTPAIQVNSGKDFLQICQKEIEKIERMKSILNEHPDEIVKGLQLDPSEEVLREKFHNTLLFDKLDKKGITKERVDHTINTAHMYRNITAEMDKTKELLINESGNEIIRIAQQNTITNIVAKDFNADNKTLWLMVEYARDHSRTGTFKITNCEQNAEAAMKLFVFGMFANLKPDMSPETRQYIEEYKKTPDLSDANKKLIAVYEAAKANRNDTKAIMPFLNEWKEALRNEEEAKRRRPSSPEASA